MSWRFTYYEPRYGDRSFTVHSSAEKRAAEGWLAEGGYSYRVRELNKEGQVARDVLTTRRRARLPRSSFALPERRALPIHNASHVRNAAARLEQMRNRGSVTAAEYARARRAIERAGRKHDVDIQTTHNRRDVRYNERNENVQRQRRRS